MRDQTQQPPLFEAAAPSQAEKIVVDQQPGCPQPAAQSLDPQAIKRRRVMLARKSGAQRLDRLERNPYRLHTVITPYFDDHPSNGRMHVHVLVSIYVIEPQPGRAKRFELRAYLDGELAANPRQKKEPHTGARHIPIEPALFADQIAHFVSRQDGNAINEVEVQPHREPRQAPRPHDGITHCRTADHQAGGRQNTVPVSLFDGLVDGGIEPEIVRTDDQVLQLVISRLRRN